MCQRFNKHSYHYYYYYCYCYCYCYYYYYYYYYYCSLFSGGCRATLTVRQMSAVSVGSSVPVLNLNAEWPHC